MRNFYRLALTGAITFALAFSPTFAAAQARRTTGTTTSSTSTRSTSSSSSENKSATTTTASRSASSQDNNRQATTATRQSSNNRQTTSTATRQTGSASTRQSSDSRQSSATTATRQTGSTATRQSGASSSSASSDQVRRTTSTTGTSTAASTSRSTADRQVSSTTTERSAATASAAQTAPQTSGTTSSSRATRANNVTAGRGLSSASASSQNASPASAPSGQRATGGAAQTQNKGVTASQPRLNYYGREMKMDDNRNLNRVPPRERDYMTYDRPGNFFDHADHYFGYRVKSLPPSHRHIRHWGIDYYYHNNVYYRRYGSYYVVCRPPVGIVIDRVLDDMYFSSVRFAYYTNAYYEFSVMDSNYRTILEQNRTIARNNALIAKQNRSLALNASRAASAYEIANALGLVQSYAGIDTDYFYEDGVFYVLNRRGRYEVIVPPAGALVDELPDDYDIIVLNGVEYYKVDDTVYRLTLIDGIPALEVLGQMYGDMARKHNYYYVN